MSVGQVWRKRLVFSSGNHERPLGLCPDLDIRDNGKRLFVGLGGEFVSVELLDGEKEQNPVQMVCLAYDAAFALGYILGQREAGR